MEKLENFLKRFPIFIHYIGSHLLPKVDFRHFYAFGFGWAVALLSNIIRPEKIRGISLPLEPI
ncbi:MAG: hypothetical protein H6Q43_149 [Deltaproteobacteria bacterium]|jgi:hypothetical protein|nr:hypothetical protein [Deltaproteobacteria bacterium]